MSGLCGGLTTFSTFAVETIQHVMADKYRGALLTAGQNLVFGIAAAFISLALGMAVAATLA